MYREAVSSLYTKGKLSSTQVSAGPPPPSLHSLPILLPQNAPLYRKRTKAMPKIDISKDLFLRKLNNYFFTNIGETRDK